MNMTNSIDYESCCACDDIISFQCKLRLSHIYY